MNENRPLGKNEKLVSVDSNLWEYRDKTFVVRYTTTVGGIRIPREFQSHSRKRAERKLHVLRKIFEKESV